MEAASIVTYKELTVYPYYMIQWVVCGVFSVLVILKRTRHATCISLDQLQILLLVHFMNMRLDRESILCVYSFQFAHFKMYDTLPFVQHDSSDGVFGYYDNMPFNTYYIYCLTAIMIFLLIISSCCIKSLLNQAQRIFWRLLWLFYLPILLYFCIMIKNWSRQSPSEIGAGFLTLVVYVVLWTVIIRNFSKQRKRLDEPQFELEASSLLEMRLGIDPEDSKVKHYYNLIWMPAIKSLYVLWAVYGPGNRAGLTCVVLAILSILNLIANMVIRPFKRPSHNIYLITSNIMILLITNLSVFNRYSNKMHGVSNIVVLTIMGLFLLSTLVIAFFVPVRREKYPSIAIDGSHGNIIITETELSRRPVQRASQVVGTRIFQAPSINMRNNTGNNTNIRGVNQGPNQSNGGQLIGIGARRNQGGPNRSLQPSRTNNQNIGNVQGADNRQFNTTNSRVNMRNSSQNSKGNLNGGASTILNGQRIQKNQLMPLNGNRVSRR